MNQIEELIQYIPTDKKMAISRQELSRKMGISDRQVRELRVHALSLGYPIITSSQFPGCYMATNIKDVIRLQKEEIHRRNELSEKISHLTNIILKWDK